MNATAHASVSVLVGTVESTRRKIVGLANGKKIPHDKNERNL